MRSGRPSPFDRAWAILSEPGHDRVHSGAEIGSARAANRSHVMHDHDHDHDHDAPRPRARRVIRVTRRRTGPTAQIVAWVISGCTLAALSVAGLTAIDRDGTSPPVATEPSATEAEPAAGTIARPDAAPDLGRRETSDERTAAATVGTDAPMPPSSAASIQPEPARSASDGGEAVVRAFYGALGKGRRRRSVPPGRGRETVGPGLLSQGDLAILRQAARAAARDRDHATRARHVPHDLSLCGRPVAMPRRGRGEPHVPRQPPAHPLDPGVKRLLISCGARVEGARGGSIARRRRAANVR